MRPSTDPRVRLGMLLACLLAAGTGCDRPGGTPASAKSPSAAVRVTAVKPARREIVRTVVLPATVRADLEVTLYNKVPGYVKDIIRDRGDRVKAGALIAHVEVPEMALELEHAKASFALEDSTLRRLEAIRKLERTAVTDQDLDLSKAKRAMAEASLKKLQTMISYCEIRAPFDGYVTERYVDPGAFLQQSKIISMEDTSKVRVLVDVPESEVRFADVGSTATVRFDALPGMIVTAKIERRSPALDTATRTMRAELDIANPERRIFPGMFAHVELAVERRTDALALPRKAIVVQQDKPFVFICVEGLARKIPITVGTEDSAWTEATGGLKGDESILIPEGQALVEGMRIQFGKGS